MKLTISERDVLNACMQYLILKGYEVIRNNTGALPVEHKGRKRLVRFGIAGSSDIIACSPNGRFVAVECKRPGGKVSDVQKDFLSRVTRKNGMAIVAYSVDDLVKYGL